MSPLNLLKRKRNWDIPGSFRDLQTVTFSICYYRQSFQIIWTNSLTFLDHWTLNRDLSRWLPLPLGQGAGQHIPHLSEEPQDVPQTWQTSGREEMT